MNVYCKYLLNENDNVKLFTVICLPDEKGTYPTVIYRKPYVDEEELMSEEKICEIKAKEFFEWLSHGYAVVFQHCRGRGKSAEG